jgi:hypothetical protein
MFASFVILTVSTGLFLWYVVSAFTLCCKRH